MIFIESVTFKEQLEKLLKKYPNVKKDFEYFKNNFTLGLGKNLGKGIYKFRIGNSSIPTGKRGGFRIILYIHHHKNKIIPVIIYSKTEKESVSLVEIIEILNKILIDLGNSN